MTDKDLFDVLDLETWCVRPIRKIFLMHNFDIEQSTQEEVRQVLFAKIKAWVGADQHRVDIVSILRCQELHEGKLVPAIEINFKLNDQ